MLWILGKKNLQNPNPKTPNDTTAVWAWWHLPALYYPKSSLIFKASGAQTLDLLQIEFMRTFSKQHVGGKEH